jgi:hypothetical protein
MVNTEISKGKKINHGEHGVARRKNHGGNLALMNISYQAEIPPCLLRVLRVLRGKWISLKFLS